VGRPRRGCAMNLCQIARDTLRSAPPDEGSGGPKCHAACCERRPWVPHTLGVHRRVRRKQLMQRCRKQLMRSDPDMETSVTCTSTVIRRISKLIQHSSTYSNNEEDVIQPGRRFQARTMLECLDQTRIMEDHAVDARRTYMKYIRIAQCTWVCLSFG
jgi:hypothetical protein